MYYDLCGQKGNNGLFYGSQIVLNMQSLLYKASHSYSFDYYKLDLLDSFTPIWLYTDLRVVAVIYVLKWEQKWFLFFKVHGTLVIQPLIDTN